MSTVTYRKGDRLIHIASSRSGTRALLEKGGFELVETETKTEPRSTWPENIAGDRIMSLLTLVYDSPDAVRAAADKELLMLRGIGPTRLAQIREALAEQ